ncbi:MAG TPA: type II toxin-antitoxin system VapC family toxin, partial [Nitrososphaerales archaeon]
RTGIIINNITLVEVGHYLRRLPKEEFLDRMSQIQNLSTLTLIDLDATVTDDAVEMLPEYSSKGLGGRDCIIIATMKLSKINRIATHDQDFREVKGLRVVDPIPRAV